MKLFYQPVLVAFLLAETLTIKAQVPVLSSYPSASSVIFLDFDGHTVNNTSWNYNGPIYCGSSGMNTTQISEIFNRVAEDYRPFNINITTDSTKYLAAPVTKRMRVILTDSSSWYGSAGGVAFVGSFIWGDDTPCFVFSALLNHSIKKVAEAASHEAGHTLGLYHQSAYDVNCVKTSEYNYGQGSGEIGWAPIMGVGYYQNLTLWNNGPNSYGCNNLQSDLDVITNGTNGFAFRTDDHLATFAGATTASFSNNQFTVSGVVERNTDQDFFKFTTTASQRFVLNAVPYNVGTGNSGSDLDMQVTLYNSSQTQLNVYNPGTLLHSVIDTILNAGTYYLKIEGKGNIYAPNYASLGSYSLQGSISSPTLPLRRLELRGAINNDQHKLNWFIEADEQVIKQVLEVSTDGRNFNALTEPDNSSRAYAYNPYISSVTQYRLNVTFDNGHQYYSNIVTLRKTGITAKPQLISNLIGGNTVEVSSPGAFTYSIYDFTGKKLTTGTLTNGSNNITTPAISGGIYIIRFEKGIEQWMEKFVKH
ncbi:MAG TPA: T9SS type A sorting domain-containing protein [Chitinophagaceae bacterium]|nr:T9SS type A sorting domain-containing protein [Chitinophagaceae bacterium]